MSAFESSDKTEGNSEEVAEVAALRPEGPAFNSHAREGVDQELCKDQ